MDRAGLAISKTILSLIFIFIYYLIVNIVCDKTHMEENRSIEFSYLSWNKNFFKYLINIRVRMCVCNRICVCVWIYKNICMYLKFVRIGWDMPAVIHFTCEYDDLMNNALLLFFFNIGITYLLFTMDRDDNSIISLRYPYEQKHI